jgi:hypothetical protein
MSACIEIQDPSVASTVGGGDGKNNNSANQPWGRLPCGQQGSRSEWMMLPSKPRSIVLPARTYFSFRFERMIGRIISKYRDTTTAAGDVNGSADGGLEDMAKREAQRGIAPNTSSPTTEGTTGTLTHKSM